MAGKYTEAQKKATKKYFDKLKSEGKTRSHGNPERNRELAYIAATLNLIRKLFNENKK